MTHLLGALLSVVGLLLFVFGEPRTATRLSTIIFALTTLVLFSASSAYHFASPQSEWKRVFRLADHVSIYLLIAGTYTPVMVSIGAPWAIRTLWLVWALAVGGIVLKAVLWDRFGRAEVLFFLAMGWLVVFHITEVIATLPQGFVWLVVTGGLSYTVGTLFYSRKSLPFHHAIWHLFVLGGALSFFLGIYLYL